jgi:outer membrane protein assembly factor BamB
MFPLGNCQQRPPTHAAFTRRTALQAGTIGLISLVHAGPVPADESDQASTIAPASTDWPWWRGFNSNGIAASDKVPVKWGARLNIAWKTAIPGRGHSSPTVVGERLFLTTADEEQKVQSVLCYERRTGKQLWKTDLHQGGFNGAWHTTNTRASSTVACDGERVCAVFYNNGAIWTTALDLQGNKVWQLKVGDFLSHQGYSASPCIYQTLLIVAADHKAGGYLVALERKTGQIRWRSKRPAVPTYASPIVLRAAGKDQLLIAGCGLVASYEPSTGANLWTCKGTSMECVGTVVSQGGLVFASGGYPDADTLAVQADGSGTVVWRKNQKAYVPCLLVYDGYLYCVTDNGVVLCWKADTGEEAWKGRLPGRFSASPILAGGHIYVPSESGKTFVFKPNPKKFEVVAENQLGSETFATPVFAGEQLFLRVADRSSGKRQEVLYCISEEEG